MGTKAKGNRLTIVLVAAAAVSGLGSHTAAADNFRPMPETVLGTNDEFDGGTGSLRVETDDDYHAYGKGNDRISGGPGWDRWN